MNVAEKRAELGDDWPECDCHGVPQKWHPWNQLPAGGVWRCTVKYNEARKRWRAKQKAKGLCTQCSEPADTETLCVFHASAHNTLMGKGKHAMRAQLAQIAYRRRKREATYG